MLRRVLPTLLLTFLVMSLFAIPPAPAEWDVDGIEELLPRQETAAERLLWQGRENEMPGRDRVNDPPPLEPIRNCAEWEPCTGVLIRYPLGLPYNLLRDFDDDVMLHVVVASSSYATAVSNLTTNGVDMAKVQWLIKPNDSIWTRDYGPWFVFDGDDEIAIIDHTYNRPARPNDDLIPIYFGEQQGIPVHHHDMWHTGGNYMTDGAHISSSTDLVYDEAAAHNGMTQAQVNQLMSDYYGIENYVVMDDIDSGGIHHIDCWAKFLDEETVLIKDVWPGHYTYNALNQRAALLASLPASTGRNYQVHRVYCYSISGGVPAAYTNSLILNDTIYIPYFGNAGYDADAKAAYEAAAPGYTVTGYTYSGWLTDDALHCRAMNVMDRGMLRVAHIPIVEQQNGAVVVSAFVHDHSNAGLSAVELHYRYQGGNWQTLNMSPSGGDYYEATIPSPVVNGPTDYYIHAQDLSGRAEGMPRVEPAAWYTFDHIVGGTDVADGAAGQAAAVLHGNYPNPFNPKTTFSFELLYADQVELAIYDAGGHRVRLLVDGLVGAGPSEIAWDGTDDAGRSLPSGVYYYRLRAAGLQYSRPAVLLK